MLTVIVRKRLLYLFFFVFLGAGLLFAGLFEIPSKLLKKEKAAAVESVQLERAFSPPPQSAPGAAGPSSRAITADKNNLDFFIEYRLDRERSRGRQIELLREIINSPSASEQARKKAQEELLAISQKLAKETELEHLIRAKGYQDATVCIEGKGVTVIVQPLKGKEPAKISAEDVARICEVVSWGTGVGEQNIIVIPKT